MAGRAAPGPGPRSRWGQAAIGEIGTAVGGLSSREADVAKLVLRGTSTRAISSTLHISPHTVQDHLKAVFDKAGVHSRRELVGQLLHPQDPEVKEPPSRT